MDISKSQHGGHSQHAVWQFFEGYNAPAEELHRLHEHFERLADGAGWEFEHVLQIGHQIDRILQRLNRETA